MAICKFTDNAKCFETSGQLKSAPKPATKSAEDRMSASRSRGQDIIIWFSEFENANKTHFTTIR